MDDIRADSFNADFCGPVQIGGIDSKLYIYVNVCFMSPNNGLEPQTTILKFPCSHSAIFFQQAWVPQHSGAVFGTVSVEPVTLAFW